MNPILLDTHVALWAVSGSLRPSIRKAIDEGAYRSELLLSPITAWEIATLVRKGRIKLAQTPAEYARALFSASGVVTAALTPAVAVLAGTLAGDLSDPADRILVASAATYGARLVTRDRAIQAFAKATKYIRVVAA